MFDLDGSLEKQLLAADRPKQSLVFPEPEDPRVIEAASMLLRFAEVILVGKEKEIRALVDYGAADLACSRDRFFERVCIVDPAEHDTLCSELAGALAEAGKGKKWAPTPEQAAQKVLDPVHFGIMLVRQGYADAVLGGVTHATRDFLAPCLRILEREGTAFEMGLFALPDEDGGPMFENNVVLFADVALNLSPSAKQLADIAVGSCQTMRDIIPREVLPEIYGALISYSTKGSGSGPSVERIREAEPLITEKLAALKERNQAYQDIQIQSEMQISVAVSPDAARTKLKDKFEALPGAGRANMLIVPSLDEGNMLYHLYTTRYPGAQSTLIMGGMKHQALDYSRGSTPLQIARGAMVLLLGRLRSEHYRPTPRDYFFPRHKVLAINPGSTSTKVALFCGEEALFDCEVSHQHPELTALDNSDRRKEFRLAVLDEILKGENADLVGLKAVVSRAGLLPKAKSGVYAVNREMLETLESKALGDHAANLGAYLAGQIAERTGAPAYVADPPTIDETDETARVIGLKKMGASRVWHALSQKAAARRYAEESNREYRDLNLIVAHLGGGISIGAHKGGRCVQVANALYDGPMSPGRSGSLPGEVLIQLCYSGMPEDELKKMLVRQGGLASHLGTSDLRRAQDMAAKGDLEASRVLAAMHEQIACHIASLVPKFDGSPVDQIILTGGLCRSEALTSALKAKLITLGVGISVYPGSNEMQALRDAALRVLKGREEALIYQN